MGVRMEGPVVQLWGQSVTIKTAVGRRPGVRVLSRPGKPQCVSLGHSRSQQGQPTRPGRERGGPPRDGALAGGVQEREPVSL